MQHVLKRVFVFRVMSGDRARMLVHKIDAKNASSQIPVDPVGAAVIEYVSRVAHDEHDSETEHILCSKSTYL